MTNKRINGLYAITRNSDRLIEEVTLAVRGGVNVIQYRDKSSDVAKRLKDATALREICRAGRVTFIVNDDVDLARAVDADGVHLGKFDAQLDQTRQLLEGRLIGISCYNDLDRAKKAQECGADYVAFGRFFPSNTKPQAIHASLSLIGLAKKVISVPIVAIGGINSSNAKEIIDLGADSVAVIEGIFGQSDIEQATRQLASYFQ